MRLTLISLGILVMAAGQALAVTPTHRWSFASDFSDSIGGATAVAVGGAVVTEGQLDLSANDGVTKGGYVDIPVTSEVFGYTNGSFEAWVTWQGGDNWQSIAGFGTDITANLSLVGQGNAQTGIDYYPIDGDGHYGDVFGPALVVDALTHIAAVMDKTADQARLYINGVNVGSLALGTWSFAGLAGTGGGVAYIGNDVWPDDPTFKGLIDEFRIYNTALTDAQVAASFAAGADATFGFHPGDANGDNMVDVGDLGILGANYGKTTGMTWATADFTGEGAVDVGDLGVLGANYGWSNAAGAVPEPATMSLLVLGAAGLIRRRR